MLCATLGGRAQEPAAPIPLTDAAVASAIDRGVAWLKAEHSADRHWEQGELQDGNRNWGGETALVALALLYAGQSPNETYLSAALDWLAKQELTGTYAVSLRAQALSLVGGRRMRETLRSDLRWLVQAAAPHAARLPGGYGYGPDDAATGWSDNSNSQYGVLGVWMATEGGAELANARQYWELIRDHWLDQQRPDGGWSYQTGGSSTGSMTAAGLASLYIVLDRLQATDPRAALPVRGALDRGLDWLGREFTPNNPGSGLWKYYYLYGVERAGRASGQKYFRSRDWFREGAGALIAEQTSTGAWPNGSEAGERRTTAFALLFLCHGRAPLIVNKLEFAGDWQLRPRDAAGLTWYAQTVLERLSNWQIVPLDGPLEDLLEAPILYWSGQAAHSFAPSEIQKLRQYCERGGMLLAVAVDGSFDLVTSFRALAQAAFPEYTVRPVPQTHPLFNGDVQYRITEPPAMLEVHNGVRTLMLLCTEDIADSWNRFRARGNRERDFELGMNLYLYATDKGLKTSRLESTSLTENPAKVRRRVRVGRVQHAGAWSIEPYGWSRLSRYMNNEAGTQVLLSSGVRLDAPKLRENYEALHVTGLGALEISDAEQQGLRRFLSDGGVLLADAANGGREFTESLEDHLRRILRTEPETVDSDSGLLTGKSLADAVDLSGTAYRRAARGREGAVRDRPLLRAFALGKRYAVIYSPLDLSVGLLGTDVYDCRGYEPASALKIMRNLLLYAAAGPAEQSKVFAAP